MDINKDNLLANEPSCGCGGCTCGADESKPLETAPASTDV